MADSAYIVAVRKASGRRQVLMAQKQVIDKPHTVQQSRLLILPNPGEFVVPGGHVDGTDASDWDAAAREFAEETGVAPGPGAVSRLLPTINVGTARDPYLLAFFVVEAELNPWLTLADDSALALWNSNTLAREVLYTASNHGAGPLTTTDTSTAGLELHSLAWVPIEDVRAAITRWPIDTSFQGDQYQLAWDIAGSYGRALSRRYRDVVAKNRREIPNATLDALEYLRAHAGSLLTP